MANDKRTIELTHEQADRVISALYMASGEYAREFKRLCERWPKDKEQNMYWHNKSGEFYDLADSIKDGQMDV